LTSANYFGLSTIGLFNVTSRLYCDIRLQVAGPAAWNSTSDPHPKH